MKSSKITCTDYINAVKSDYSECNDGLTVTAQQGKFALDCSHWSGTFADGEDFAVYMVEQYENPESEVCNFTYTQDFNIEHYKHTGATVYHTREEMMHHVTGFMIEHNHF